MITLFLGRTYDQKTCVRGFSLAWETEFLWLRLTDDKTAMYCVPCKERSARTHSKQDATAPFVKGCTNFRRDTIVKHAKSEVHLKASGTHAAQVARVGSTPAEKMLTTLNRQTFDRLCRMFRTCHALVKHARPYTDYVWLCNVDKKKGLDAGTAYRNDKQARLFTHHIAEIARERIRDSEIPFGVISDGSTDSAALEAEMIYVRHAHRGAISVNFAGYVNVERANTPGILDAITTAMSRLNVTPADWQQKLVGFGSDGASVMVGKNNGVVALLRQLQPTVQGVHCAAH